MAMTKKDYAVIADAIRSIDFPLGRRKAAFALARELGAQNERFDAEKFIEACGIDYSVFVSSYTPDAA